MQKTGDTLSGGLTFENDSVLAWIRNTDWAKIGFKNDADSDTDSYMWFETGDNGNEYFKWRSRQSTTTKDLMNLKWDALYVLVNAVISGSLSVGTTKKFTLSNGNSSTKNATFNLWGNSSRPVVAELGDDSGWHFYSQRNTDDSITFAVNGQIAPGNWSNFDSRYALKTAAVTSIRLGTYTTQTMQRGVMFEKAGYVITGLGIIGEVDGDDPARLRPLQYCINGSWYTAATT
ncbi:TPA: phage tail protein [Escherichia coli]|nr:phage tail protein [Escherichia coli]HAX5183460.1 phage tail protein [Escherichia coli]HAX5233100.1 phage tail protein [Escherichia coli]